jgi:hypothetical protein
MTQSEITPTKKFGLSGNVLKVIAIIAMTIDHLAWLGKFFYWYYLVHMFIIGWISHMS